MTGVAADLATLRELLYGRGLPQREQGYAALARVEAELSRLREERDAAREDVDLHIGSMSRWAERAKAAEARCARLQQALADLVEDYEESDPFPTSDGHPLYAAREALAGQTSGSGSSAADPSVGERQGRQPDPGDIAGLLVELSRWSRVAELNGDLHARIASALAGPDTPVEEEA